MGPQVPEEGDYDEALTKICIIIIIINIVIRSLRIDIMTCMISHFHNDVDIDDDVDDVNDGKGTLGHNSLGRMRQGSSLSACCISIITMRRILLHQHLQNILIQEVLGPSGS